MIKVSVVIPIYNVEKYIRKCMMSVLAQALTEDEFEIIVVDDASPDDSARIAAEIAKSHQNIHLITQQNKGLGGARNTGITEAKGQFILFLDSDDYLLPNTLHQVVAIAIEHNLDILEFGAQGVSPKGTLVYEVSRNSKEEIRTGIEYYNGLRYMNSACNKLYSRALLKKHKFLFEEQLYIEDFEFNTRVFYYAQRVMAINTIVARYLQSPDSITRNTSEAKKEKMESDIIKVLSLTKQFADQAMKTSSATGLSRYFGSRLSFINVTLFYQLVKNKRPYSLFLAIKKQLVQDQLFQVHYAVGVRSKDLFRIGLRYFFWLFKISQYRYECQHKEIQN